MSDILVTVPSEGESALTIPDWVGVPVARLSDSTPAGRSVITAADAAAIRTALGMTAAGSAVATAADASAQRTALGLGTAATTPATDYATAAQGATADAAQPAADLDADVAALVADSGSALAAGLLSTFARRRTRTVWGIGDSLTAGSASGGGGLTYDSALYSSIGQPAIWYQGGSWAMWALIYSQAKWTFGGFFATGGYTAAQILSTHVPSVIAAASPGDTVVVLAGTNGNVLADVKTIHSTLRAAGLHTVAVTIPPSTAAGLDAVSWFNAGLKQYAAANDIPIADVHAAVVDTATGAYASAYNGDGVHPSQAGDLVFGQAIGAVLNGFFPTAVSLANHNAAIAGRLQTKPLALDTPASGTEYSSLSSLGTSTIAAAANANFAGGYGYLFTRGDTDINARMKTMTLVAGHRIRLGMSIETSSGSGTWGMRLESNTTGQKILLGLGYTTNVSRTISNGRFYVEFVVPTLPDYTYRLRLNITGAGTTVHIGEVTVDDLTAMGAA